MDQEVSKDKATALDLARLKSASEAYRVHKSIYLDPVTGEPETGYQLWPEFRDEFLNDWKSNRRIVTEKEADVHFDRIADESLNELETTGIPVDVNQVVDQVEQTQVSTEETEIPSTATAPVSAVAAHDEVHSAPKRRGRPPGTGKAKLKVVGSNGQVAPKRRGRPVGSTSKSSSVKKMKKVAAKKKGGGTSTKAESLILKFGPKGRKWPRKDVIQKLVDSIDGLGAPYAASLYQKYA